LQTYISNHEKYNQIVNEHKEDMDPIVVEKIQNIGIPQTIFGFENTVRSCEAKIEQTTSR
jgi:hypothetical protein